MSKNNKTSFTDFMIDKLFSKRKLSIPQMFGVILAPIVTISAIGLGIYSRFLLAQPTTVALPKLLIAFALITFGMLAFFLWGLSQMNADIVTMSNTMKSVEENDLTVELTGSITKVNSEIGFAAKGLNSVIKSLHTTVATIKDSGANLGLISEDVLSAASDARTRTDEIANTMNEIACDISEQAGYATQNNTAISNLSKKLDILKDNTDNISEAANNVSNENKQGLLNIKELEEYSSKNDDASKAVFKHINELISKINNIEGIVQTMTGIAEQTNLLALNAAIEAARAGEMGAGFSVVAGEVKKLAEQSAKHADTIRTIVSDIQKDVESSVDVMKESERISQEQSKVVESVVKSFNEISVATKSMESSIESTVSVVKEINQDKDLIVENIENTAIVSQRSAAATEEITASLREQSNLAALLVESASSLDDISKNVKENLDVFKLEK